MVFLARGRFRLVLQLLDLALQRFVFVQLAAQESRRDHGFFLDALGRQEIEIGALVVAVAEIVDLDEALLDQRLQAEVDAPKAKAQLVGDPPLAGVRVGLQQLQDPVASLVGQHGLVFSY
jgi:hypothetical protein